MAGLNEALKDAVGGAFCAATAPLDRVVALGEDLYNEVGAPGFPTGKTPLGQGLTAARDLFCGEPPRVADSGFDPGFTGGQCEGVLYSFNRQSLIDGSPNGGVAPSSGVGPISVEKRSSGPGLENVVVVLGDGSELPCGGGSSSSGNFTCEITNVQRLDGEPDECGDGDVVPPPYREDDFSPTVPVDYDDTGGNPTTINVPLVFAPVSVNNDLQFEVPVKVNFSPDISVNGTLNLSTGDTVFNTSFDIQVPTPITDPTIQFDPTVPDGDPETEEEEIGKTIIGVYVLVTSVGVLGEKREIFSNTPGSNLYGPRLGSVSFHCETKVSSGLAWTEDIDVKYNKQTIYCPIPWGARSVVVTPVSGVSLMWFPIRGESERDLALRAAGVS